MTALRRVWVVAALQAVCAQAGQVPGRMTAPDIPVNHRDRVYAAEQFSNTVSVTDPADNTLLGVIRLGEPSPGNLSPVYRGQLLVHGLGFSPDHRTLAVVSIGSNSVTFIDTATNGVRHITYVGRSPHEAFFTPDGQEVWVTVRGENYISVLDARTYAEKARITVPGGPGMQIFSPDGKYGYVCSSFNPETVVITVADHQIVGRVPQPSPFCPNIAATPDGKQVWITLKDTGKVLVFDAQPPFTVLRTIDTGPITNHVNFAKNGKGLFAYVTVGGLNVVKVFRVADAALVATVPVGKLPHGVWPSGDGKRMYVGIENGDSLTAIDTITNRVIAEVPIGQAPQAIVYVPLAVPEGSGTGTDGLQPLGVAGEAAHLALAPPPRADAGDVGSASGAGAAAATGTGPAAATGTSAATTGTSAATTGTSAAAATGTGAATTGTSAATATGTGAGAMSTASAPTSVALFDQGLLQVLQVSATGLEPKQPYILALADQPDGSGTLQPLASFVTNPAGAAIVNAIGPIRQIVEVKASTMRRYLVIASGSAAHPGAIVQVQMP